MYYIWCYIHEFNVHELIALLQSNQIGNQLNLTCSSNGKSSIYLLADPTSSQIQGLCSQLCNWFGRETDGRWYGLLGSYGFISVEHFTMLLYCCLSIYTVCEKIFCKLTMETIFIWYASPLWDLLNRHFSGSIWEFENIFVP